MWVEPDLRLRLTFGKIYYIRYIVVEIIKPLYTVKPVLRGHSKIGKTKVLKTDGS